MYFNQKNLTSQPILNSTQRIAFVRNNKQMGKKAIVFLANGFEETEALAPTDIMRRCGIDVTLISINETRTVTSSHNIVITADQTINDKLTEYDLIFLPGGMPGTNNLNATDIVKNEVISAYNNGRHIAAICAAPLILGQLGLLNGKKATCFPGFEEHLKGAQLTKQAVVTDGRITTAIGAGASLKLGIELVAILIDQNTANNIANQIQLNA